nr:DUF523 domain-containing protein [uncultured bacterium]
MILLSACLAGKRCRYDGGGFDRYPELARMVEEGRAVPVCPEELGGLPTPRPPAEIQGGDGRDVLAGNARITRVDGKDVTEAFLAGARKTLSIAQTCGATAAVLKGRSPSCGAKQIYAGAFDGALKPGQGVTAALLESAGLTLYDEDDFPPSL